MLKISKCLCNYFSSVHCQDLAAAASVDSFCSIFLQKSCETFCLGNLMNISSSYNRKMKAKSLFFCIPNLECITLKHWQLLQCFCHFPDNPTTLFSSSGICFCFASRRCTITKLQLISLLGLLACYDCISFPAHKIGCL